VADSTHVDDKTIADDESLLRRVPPVPDYYWIYDRRAGRARPSSAAFKDREMSVFLLSLLEADGRPAEDALQEHHSFFLVSITAGLARQCGQAVCKDPEPDPAHGLVVGEKKKAVLSRFARAAVWVIGPAGAH
jgi:hypothetical protein